MGYSKADQFFYMQAIETKAARAIYLKWGINGRELNLLMMLATYLQIKGKKVVSFEILMDWVGCGRQLGRLCRGYAEGLVRHGCLHQLTYKNQKNPGNSLAIAPYGARILLAYYEIIEALERSDRARKSNPSMLENFVSEPPPGYTARQMGRND